MSTTLCTVTDTVIIFMLPKLNCNRNNNIAEYRDYYADNNSP
jgi:hypothetical protein